MNVSVFIIWISLSITARVLPTPALERRLPSASFTLENTITTQAATRWCPEVVTTYIWGEKCDMNVFSSAVLPLRPQEFPLALLPDVFTCNVLLSKMELSAWTANIRLFWRNRIYAPKKTSQPFRTRGKTELEKSLPSWVRWLMLSLMFCHKHMYFPMLVTCDKPFFFFFCLVSNIVDRIFVDIVKLQ